MNDTIFAVSSGEAPTAIAVMRVSGPMAFAAIEALAGSVPAPRRATLRTLVSPDGDMLDRALVLVFAAPASATGEDIAEFHLHGGRATIAAVAQALAGMPGLRAAEPGEFTRRALENGRIDLTEAEGLADLLAAETETQRRASLRVAEGGLRRQVEGWTDRTLAMAAMIEAAIDHGDEDDVDDDDAIAGRVRADARDLADEIAIMLRSPPAERLRDGIRVVLAGPPNSGKSSLFNAMAGRDAAIVSPIAGTTRDRIEAPVVEGGVAWLLIDTAGLREDTADAVEAIGVDRAAAAVATADLVLWLGDDAPPGANMIALHARADAPGRESIPAGRIAVSALRGTIGDVWTTLHRRARDMLPAAEGITLNARQHLICCDAEKALRAASLSIDPLLVADGIRHARVAFDRMTGRAGTEEMLDALFGRFCLGK